MISVIDGMRQPYGCVQRLSVVDLCDRITSVDPEEAEMAKSARKRRARRKKSANHGKRPNA
jgi:hypothetical protein